MAPFYSLSTLHQASLMGNVQVLTLLLDSGIPVDQQDSKGALYFWYIYVYFVHTSYFAIYYITMKVAYPLTNRIARVGYIHIL